MKKRHVFNYSYVFNLIRLCLIRRLKRSLCRFQFSELKYRFILLSVYEQPRCRCLSIRYRLTVKGLIEIPLNFFLAGRRLTN